MIGGPQPTDYIPVMRYHVYLACLSLEAALNKESAEDIIQAVREGRDVPKESALSRKLRVSLVQLNSCLEETVEEEEAPVPKLTPEQILEAREAVRQGQVPEELAANFGGNVDDELPQ